MIDDDLTYFKSNPGRVWRLRRATAAERDDSPYTWPPGEVAWVIINRHGPELHLFAGALSLPAQAMPDDVCAQYAEMEHAVRAAGRKTLLQIIAGGASKPPLRLAAPGRW
jgi:hypothetical protein